MVIPSRRFRANDIAVTDIEKEEKTYNTGIVPKVEDRLSIQGVLQHLCENNLLGVVYLVSGIKLEGYFHSFDDEVIILESPDRDNKQLIYQSTVATLHPKD